MKSKVIALMLLIAVGAGVAVASARSTDKPTVARDMPPVGSFVLAVEQVVDGKTWALGRSRYANGDGCLELRSPTGWRAASCLSPSLMFARGPIYAETGGAGPVSFIQGAVTSGIERLELVRADCSTQRLPVSAAGLFLSVTPASTAGPWQLRGYDRRGNLLATHTLEGRGAASPSGAC